MYRGAGVLAFHRGGNHLEVLLGLRTGRAVSFFGALRASAAPTEPLAKRIVRAPLRSLNRGRWSILGGGAEGEEPLLATAAREFEEEAGLPPELESRAELQSRLSVFAPHRIRLMGFTWDTYFLEMASKPESWPNPKAHSGSEWTECRWVEARALPEPVHRLLPPTLETLERAVGA